MTAVFCREAAGHRACESKREHKVTDQKGFDNPSNFVRLHQMDMNYNHLEQETE